MLALAVVLALPLAAACGPSGSAAMAPVNAAACDERGAAIIRAAPTCRAAVDGLNDLMRREPACLALFGRDASAVHYDCPDAGDGGTDGP